MKKILFTFLLLCAFIPVSHASPFTDSVLSTNNLNAEYNRIFETPPILDTIYNNNNGHIFDGNYFIQGIQAEQGGYVDKIKLPLFVNYTGSLDPILTFQLWSTVNNAGLVPLDPVSDTVSITFTSTTYTESSFYSACGITNPIQYNVYDLTNCDSYLKTIDFQEEPYFNAGDKYLLLIRNQNSNWYSYYKKFNLTTNSVSSYIGNFTLCNSDFSKCTNEYNPTYGGYNYGSLAFSTYVRPDEAYDGFLINEGPYLKNVLSAPPDGYYRLYLECKEEGDIYISSDTLSINDDLIYEGCQTSDYIDLELSPTNTLTNWSIEFWVLGELKKVYNITVFAGLDTSDGLLNYYSNNGGNSNDPNVLQVAFGKLYELILDIPIFGDILTINDVLFRDYYMKLGDEDTMLIEVDTELAGVDIDYSFNLSTIQQNFQDKWDDIPNHTQFEGFLTAVFCFWLIFGLFNIYSKHDAQ